MILIETLLRLLYYAIMFMYVLDWFLCGMSPQRFGPTETTFHFRSSYSHSSNFNVVSKSIYPPSRRYKVLTIGFTETLSCFQIFLYISAFLCRLHEFHETNTKGMRHSQKKSRNGSFFCKYQKSNIMCKATAKTTDETDLRLV